MGASPRRCGICFSGDGITASPCSRQRNGRATLTTDQSLLAPSAVEGKVPKLGILVAIEEAYTQCSKALIRSELWNPARFIDRSVLPTNGQIHEVLCEGDFDGKKHDEERAARYARRENFY